MWYDRLLEKNLIPDFLIRRGIRSLNRLRLRQESEPTAERQQEKLNALVEFLKKSPIAVMTDKANEQHYEVPAAFYELCLGKNRKYSSAYYPEKKSTLDEAEDFMLQLTCERAELKNGQSILELGCGWGSLTLFMAQKYPKSKITGVSNSHSQREYILQKAKQLGLKNVQIITADMNHFKAPEKYDRVVSVEMFEHMRNYAKLLANIASWLKKDGKLFVHIFTHRELSYLFEVKDETDWMSKYFFSGGIMPSDHLLYYFADDLVIKKHWRVDGTHYQRTAEDWLRNMDRHKQAVLELFRKVYGADQALKWFVYWRIFYMAVAELFGMYGGREWLVSHYLFEKRQG